MRLARSLSSPTRSTCSSRSARHGAVRSRRLTRRSDVLSLIVALYTIKLATSPSSAENSYGWQRAEILGALINGVFLIALCSTIALEAIGRIVSPPGA